VATTTRELESLYRDRYLSFRRGLASLTGSYDSAHDVVQEAFARAIAERRTFRGDGPLGAWVWRIAFRIALDERRDAAHFPIGELFDPELVEPAADPELADALRGLPPRRRLVFFLRYFADLTYAEIAETCGISEGTVAASLTHARADLAAALKGGVTT
jgi:RNA polymerase sigma-70 factor (ECF subfamily)